MRVRDHITRRAAEQYLPHELHRAAVRVAHALLAAGYGTGAVADVPHLAQRIHRAAEESDYDVLSEIATTWYTPGIMYGNSRTYTPLPGMTEAQKRAAAAFSSYLAGVRYGRDGDPRDALNFLHSSWSCAEQSDGKQVQVAFQPSGYAIEGYAQPPLSAT
ncbi:hypothetical protein GCM10009733_020700 [Nonomuraea maheshkhaliensis]|uniref:Cell wall hydrolase SleB domain-containing protein n=1 Tax=Nonomuraea maheshkhaliensis TaxID=419590 RepID=A0ABN2EZK2_9ACTN